MGRPKKIKRPYNKKEKVLTSIEQTQILDNVEETSCKVSNQNLVQTEPLLDFEVKFDDDANKMFNFVLNKTDSLNKEFSIIFKVLNYEKLKTFECKRIKINYNIEKLNYNIKFLNIVNEIL